MDGLSQSMKPNLVKTEAAVAVAQVGDTAEGVAQAAAGMEVVVALEVVAADEVATKPILKFKQQNSPRRKSNAFGGCFISYRRPMDRKTTGSINELILAADHVLADGDVSPHEVGFKINDVLLSALASEGFGGYGQPREAFKKLATQQDG